MALARSRKTRRKPLFEPLQYYSGLPRKQHSFALTHYNSGDNWLPSTNIPKTCGRLEKRRAP
jgi:hypothetical protein